MLMLLAMVSCNTENLEKTTDTTIETESATEGTSADATDATSAETTVADETTADATESDTTEPESTTAEDESSEETTVETTEEETKKPIVEAGLDSGVVRDGTPKKYFTLSFDDGMVSDAKIIEILNK